MATTQLQPGAWGGKRYGTFAGKEASADGPITQLQPGGWGGKRYGSFASKTASAAGTARNLPLMGAGT